MVKGDTLPLIESLKGCLSVLFLTVLSPPLTSFGLLLSGCCPALLSCCCPVLQTVTTVVILTFLLVGGYYVRGIPVWISWLRYLSFLFWGYSLMIKSQFK